jgi:hypothetical protein
MMTRILLAMTAITALAAPAAAQYSSQTNLRARGAVSFDQRIDRLENRIDAGIDAGVIDRREARGLRNELRLLRRTELSYGRDGINAQEHSDLQARVRGLRDNIRLADGGYRYDRRLAYDDDDSYYGVGGPMETEWVVDENAQARTGVPGIFDQFLGGGLRVGARASSNLYGLDADDRGQFRDTSSVYYRTDGARVYEIDARTRTITRVWRRAE